MKEFNSNILIFLLTFQLLYIQTIIIQDSLLFFDSFLYKDIAEIYSNQLNSKTCKLLDGPNCIQIKNKFSQNSFIKFYKEKINTNITKPVPIPEIIENLKTKTEKQKDKNKAKIKSPYNLDSPVVLSLLLSFESYDETTRYKDIYAPDVIDTPFDMGRITLSLFGKLRLTQNNHELFENPEQSINDYIPKNTYGIVESKELIIRFNGESILQSLYIKRNIFFNKNNKSFILYGYKNNLRYKLSVVKNVPIDSWLKVTPKDMYLDYVSFPRGFDYDNLVFIHNSHDEEKYQEYNKKFNKMINQKINNMMTEVLSSDKIKNGQNQIITVNINEGEIDRDDFDLEEYNVELFKKNNNFDELLNNENNIKKEEKDKKEKKKKDRIKLIDDDENQDL